MRKVWLLLFVFAGIAEAAGSHGKIHFLNNSVNFGNVTKGEELKYRFHFENASQGKLRIVAVHAACGCTLAEMPKDKEYAAGERGYIDVALQTARLVGPVTKVITVTTDDLLSPTRTLTLSANVQAEFVVDPLGVDFGVVDFGSSAGAAKVVQSVQINPVGNFPLVVKGLTFNKEILDVKLLKKAGSRWQIDVSLKPVKKLGLVKEVIVVANSSKALSQLRILVKADVRGPIRFEPSSIEFGSIAKAEQAKRLIRLQAERGFQIKKSWWELSLNGKPVTNAEEIFAVQALDRSDGEKDVEVTVKNAGSLPGSVQGKLFLETSDPTQQRIVLDFNGFFL